MNDSALLQYSNSTAPSMPLTATPRHAFEFLNVMDVRIGGLFFMALYFLWLSSSFAPVVKARVTGYRSFLEPTFLLRMRFVTNGANMLRQGYSEVKDSFFIVKRMDTDITIVPPKYLDELRLTTPETLSSTHANIHNMLGKYTNLNDMLESDQFVRAIRDHLNPNLNKFTNEMQVELDYAFELDAPKNDEWQEIDVQALIRKVVSRMAARLSLGFPLCRNETWLSIAREHTLCVFATTLTLRMLPPILHPIVSVMLPQRWRIWRNIREAERIIGPVIEEYMAGDKHGSSAAVDPTTPAPLLQWMVDNATPAEKSVKQLILRQLSLTVASIYTSSQTASHLIFDLAAHPEYIDAIRDEMAQECDAAESGKIDASKLSSLDACLTESLRINPPLLDAPNRQAMENITLKDGTLIPKGAMLGFPCLPLAQDPSIYPDPQQYRPFRRENRSSPSVSPNKTRLVFGWGKQACPGRFFAVKEIKMIMARILSEYDIRFPDGKSRPRSFDVDDYRLLDPRAKLLMRRRRIQ